MLEEVGWLIAFILTFVIVHYQFKYCIPITLWTLKFIEVCVIILFAKMYVVFRVYGEQVDVSMLKEFFQHFINVTKEDYFTEENYNFILYPGSPPIMYPSLISLQMTTLVVRVIQSFCHIAANKQTRSCRY